MGVLKKIILVDYLLAGSMLFSYFFFKKLTYKFKNIKRRDKGRECMEAIFHKKHLKNGEKINMDLLIMTLEIH